MSSRSGAVKRLLAELKDLQQNPSPDLTAAPLEDNMLEWHFTIRGPSDGGFAGGRYHGRIIFPADYPFKPPNISFLTPNGRFEVGKKICLSITGHHPEFWRPAWGCRSALVALIGFLPTPGEGAIGALDYTEPERAEFAKRSRDWTCPSCGSCNRDVLPDEADKPVEKLVAEEGLTFTMKADGDAAPASSTNDHLGSESPLTDPTPSIPTESTPVVAAAALHARPQSSLSSAASTAVQPNITQPQLRVPAAQPVVPQQQPIPAGARAPEMIVIPLDQTTIRKRQIDTCLMFVCFLIACLLLRRLNSFPLEPM
ncbi:hypothetical protein SmJEL517_g01845 [Synchytrium microbalum]|uniref:UBC core domain-containing protein n=1 Tax=Synchytrium microbalum TaxID=1806994 RepID=A0A507C978_9FUNG|nr:uncharacterized protein SmJEL517_g01845 [Synchytrium microbalum]TPX35908.1 hypothetical protein SmJEL517_g01845 [Synchytrium microbalum]